MTDAAVGRAIRSLRQREGSRQLDVARRAGVSRSMVAEIEAGRIGPHRLDKLRSVVGALGGFVRLQVLWRGAELARLLDSGHAALQAGWKAKLERYGWVVPAEVTFNHFGERGSVDLLAFHPARQVLLVAEIKTGIFDIQGLLAPLDRRVRLGARLASRQGWRPRAVVPALIVADGTTARRRLAGYAPLFALRGRAVAAWLRAPAGSAPSGLLILTKGPDDRFRDARRAGRQRVRPQASRPRSAELGPDDPMTSARS